MTMDLLLVIIFVAIFHGFVGYMVGRDTGRKQGFQKFHEAAQEAYLSFPIDNAEFEAYVAEGFKVPSTEYDVTLKMLRTHRGGPQRTQYILNTVIRNGVPATRTHAYGPPQTDPDYRMYEYVRECIRFTERTLWDESTAISD